MLSKKESSLQATFLCHKNVCMPASMYITMYVCIYMYVYMYVCMYIRYVYMYVCMYVCMYVYVCMYKHMYVCIYVCIACFIWGADPGWRFISMAILRRVLKANRRAHACNYVSLTVHFRFLQQLLQDLSTIEPPTCCTSRSLYCTVHTLWKNFFISSVFLFSTSD